MALQGSLSDIGAVELVQFAHTGRKSGELLLASPDQEAHLYYEQGQLVHASLGTTEGLDVLVEIFGWAEAQFSFTAGVRANARTIHLDLPRALMSALKMRDDRMAASRVTPPEPGATTEQGLRAQLASIVARFVSGTPHIQYACVFDAKGRTLAESGGTTGNVEELDQLKAVVRDLVTGHPRGELEKIFLIDAMGTVAASRLRPAGLAMAVAAERAPLGAVSIAIAKLSAVTGQLGQDRPEGPISP